MTYAYIPILMIFIVLYIEHRNKTVMLKQLISLRKKRKEKRQMLEMAKHFIGKECIIYTFNSQLSGTVKEISDGALLLESNGSIEAVNLDFVVRIREYPRNKKGKKKSVVID